MYFYEMKIALLFIFLLPIIEVSAQKDSIRKSSVSEVTVLGKMKEMYKNDSPIPIENYTNLYFKKAAVSNLLDASSQITGLRPQLNCSVCNTGDIHLNGMEGAYTTILIDGMPIVSSLSSIYGLSGIPLSMIDRIEVIKGPASVLYGSEAMAGTINIITKSATQSDLLSFESSLSSTLEVFNDVSFRWKKNKMFSGFTSINHFNYQNKLDVNHDHFTDVALQNRISIFNKIDAGTSAHPFLLAFRVVHENRWGGELNWKDQFKGTDSVYGETIKTNRIEIIQSWKIPIKQNVEIQNSYVYHEQESYYGVVPFFAKNHTVFNQISSRKKYLKSEFLVGLSSKINYYDDNTILTRNPVDTTITKAQFDFLPGLFIQYETINKSKWKSIFGLRTDFHQKHGVIFSPRMALQYKYSELLNYRFGMGRGFRVVNVFTEDHAALSGDRKVVISEQLNPETSINPYLAVDYFSILPHISIKTEAHLFYNYFFNRIQANYDINPNEIIYQNLNGYSTSRGLNLKCDIQSDNQWDVQVGITLLDAYEKSKSQKKVPIMFSSIWNINLNVSYSISKIDVKLDYQCVVYSPMRLPVLPNDFRPEYSPWYSIHQLQITHTTKFNLEYFIVMKNMFNFLPSNPLMRPFDPFDKNVSINNPNNYTFDTTYGFAPMQGRRITLGLRYKLVK